VPWDELMQYISWAVFTERKLPSELFALRWAHYGVPATVFHQPALLLHRDKIASCLIRKTSKAV
jgi:hypothetical protein